MIPKLHKRGRSFRGAANYLLHDKGRAKTNHRVEWTQTLNLATTNPHAAWRVMAATAMDQDRLKAQAGIKNTGRKSVDSVLHMTISWHPDESAEVSREEMVRAAREAIAAIGAEDRQAILVSHNDEPQKHVHILINRVSPTDGRMLPSSKERLKLSKWAQKYEQQRGEILCEQRVLNNRARDRGEYTRHKRDKARHIHELSAANDNRTAAERCAIEQAAIDKDLGIETRKLKVRQASQIVELAERHSAIRTEIKAKARAAVLRARDRVRSDYRPRWERQHREHERQIKEFERNEKKLTGRISNTLRRLDLKSMLRGENRSDAIKEVYNVASSSGARRVALKREQAARDRQLLAEQRRQERKAAKKVRDDAKRELAEQRSRYLAERGSLVLTHDLERAANRTAWRTRSQQRRAAFELANRSDRWKKPEPEKEDPEARRVRELTEAFERLQQRKAQEPKDRDRDDGRER